MPSLTPVAIAILSQGSQFLMQLRDDLPGILYPGHWGLFGGHLEAGESPEAALRRELFEEISYCPPAVEFFGMYNDEKICRYVFWGQLAVGLEELDLREGWDLALVPEVAIRQGYFYSPKPNAEKPLGTVHQKIILDFIDASHLQARLG
ncbi:NUDIX domain-containing protein [Thermosynechococcaceae cyanobacterium BACA0444]|uniref:NUDIX domain-containing protein n=1 Tax=Pseudocalidococcus azoricus BACA0444 TaxID=2918990 RepID=A0AAE4FSF9_9CYAN|nr:NUDIX domain-containing protein [Pseudocalidococcus azoricus]MDS3860948.1 NUDIX domain-containing protein [Pseudocalidococcus azoricus BACA0444]